MNTYFSNEVRALQNRFNDHYAGKAVIDLRTRQLLILGIIGLKLVASTIKQEEDRQQRQQHIADFMRKRAILHKTLHRLETEERHEKTRKLSNSGHGRSHGLSMTA